MKYLLLIATLIFSVALFSCSDDNDTNPQPGFANWQSRNDSAFSAELTLAKNAIATAKTTYGNDWEAHSDYRLLTNFLITTGRTASSTDTVIVRIIQRGTGSAVTPLYSDSVRLNYRGYTIPLSTTNRPWVFDHSGIRSDSASIFDPALGQPTKFAVGGVVIGLTTALQKMSHIGDTWRVYIPYQLGYGTRVVTNSAIPAYTNLIFEIQLKAVYRKGTRANW